MPTESYGYAPLNRPRLFKVSFDCLGIMVHSDPLTGDEVAHLLVELTKKGIKADVHEHFEPMF